MGIIDALETLDLDTLASEENYGDVFIEESEAFADSVDEALKRCAHPDYLDGLFNYGLSYRQDELSQRLVGQHDHPSFKIIDAALDLLDN